MPPRRKQETIPKGTVSSGTKVVLDVREPANGVSFQPGSEYSHLEDVIPIANEVLPVKFRGKKVTLDSGYTLVDWNSEGSDSTRGLLTVRQSNGIEKQVRAYKKSMALIDPFTWMRYKVRPSEPFFWFSQVNDVNHPTNQGYVDTVASALVSKIGRDFHLPHFCEFYGAFRGVVKSFFYNLEDDLEDVRFTKWFWAALEAKEFGLRVVEKESGRQLTLDEIIELMKPDDDNLTDTEESDEDESDNEDEDEDEDEDTSEIESLGAEELPLNTPTNQSTEVVLDLQEDEPETEDEREVVVHRRKVSTLRTADTFSTTSDDRRSYGEDFTIHAELYNMPVAVMFLECMEGTMDELLENESLSPIKSSQDEVRWGSWMVQICAALSQIQRHVGMTHNDLHTNNVLWKSTNQEFVVYKDNHGRQWRVPTFGKLFTIIDYGRSIFLLNGYHYISSDYNEGHDADGMYNFGRLEDEDLPKVFPNKSFDLSRLACSLLRGLFPNNPDFRLNAPLLTKEGDWEIRESDHPLFNLIWSWLRAEDGTNILETQSGAEKYPGFELYSIIAATVHGAVPEKQFMHKMIQVFAVKQGQQGTEKPILLYL